MIGLSGRFNPSVLVVTATSSFVFLFLENIVLNLCFYLLASASPPPVLDTVSYTFYKFVSVNASLVVDILFGYTAFWAASVTFGLSMGMFMVSF